MNKDKENEDLSNSEENLTSEEDTKNLQSEDSTEDEFSTHNIDTSKSDKFFEDMFNSSNEDELDDDSPLPSPELEYYSSDKENKGDNTGDINEGHQENIDDDSETDMYPIIANEPLNLKKDVSEKDKNENLNSENAPMTRAEAKRQEKNKKKKKTAFIVIPLIVLLAAAGGYFGFKYFIESETTLVPNAMKNIDYDQNVKEVCGEFTDAELKCEVKWEINDSADRGSLLQQSVKSKEKVDIGTNVVLTYSNGPSTSEFPNLNNVNIEEAKSTLYDMNIEVSEVKEVDGNGMDAGNIVSTSIEPGTKVSNGDSVNIEVSNGKIKLPNWSGKTKEYVEAEAEKLGIEVKFTEEESDKASGIVVSQTPKAGETNTSTEVNVVISKAFKAKEIEVPDVIGKTAEEAQTELATAGFRQIKTVKVKNEEVTETQVTQVVPGVGQKGNSEENIVIIVSEPVK